ncbi:MAG TPA: cob(I)yrinic acid a,c-diamide adenosyltransferase [Deltaproteobacteria bacterium]|nr:MAG: ATP:cob(I)alamin adenosyltransferase [Deltaproteobacteria bacterium GWA2_45_12]HBF12746.1 cob(I)yrinic acid a,c-diamide adenosyltransferase [Deltaproteobacteria bacterium]
MTKIYTKTGDDGTTSLFDGTRVKKNHSRIQAYGDVDELNSVIGCAFSFIKDQELKSQLAQVQKDLFALGAKLANPTHKKQKAKSDFPVSKVSFLEQAIDAFDKELPPMKGFILPGGTQGASQLHLARTVCRRAERNLLALKKEEDFENVFEVYINRLSDYLFMAARMANHREGIADIPWN